MATRVGINGFGRIGRNVFRAGAGRDDVEFVAINDLPVPVETMAYMLKYDSIFGQYPGEVDVQDGQLIVDGRPVAVVSHRDPAEIPWKDLGADIVVESTGIFRDKASASKHLEGGAERVIITAPAKDEDITIVLGVNEDRFDPDKHVVISNASCTTNCVAPMAKVIMERFGLKRGLMTTIHSYTNDQRLCDLAHKDLRRSRAATLSMIPTSTGAAVAVGLVLPELKGKLDGLAIRVPTPDVSVVDLSVEVERATTTDEVNAAFREYATGELSTYLEYSDTPLVSSDFLGNANSCIFDPRLTYVVDETLVKVFGWYDNEWGYSNRVVDLIAYITERTTSTAAATA